MILPEETATFLLDWQSAELAAVEHMKSLGFIDAQKTQSGADGGIDVESSLAAAQVKFYASPVGRPDIQRLRGAAHDYRISVFYSTGGYTKEAVQYADGAGVALFLMDPYGSAEPHSEFAEKLTKSEMIQERREQLEELKAVRYRFAAASFEQDLSLYAAFLRETSLIQPEAALYSHVFNELDLAVRTFVDAVGERQFEAADSLFEEINKRIGFLAWITGPELRDPYDDLNDAVSAGWDLESDPESEYLLQRIATGAFDLLKVSLKFLEEWDGTLPAEVSTNRLADDELRRAAGMLLSASFDESILSAELIARLKQAVREGVQRVHSEAHYMFMVLFDMHVQHDLERPRSLVDGKLLVDALVTRINRQLDASGA